MLLIHDIVKILVIGLGFGDDLLYYLFGELAHRRIAFFVYVGRFSAHTRNDKRRTCLIDKNGVHLIDYCKIVPALHLRLKACLEVIPKIVKAELIVGPVGYISGIVTALFGCRHFLCDNAGAQSEIFVNTSHLACVTHGKIVIDGNYVNAFAGKGVEICRHCGNKRFSFTGLHFRDPALMKQYTAQHLNAEGTFAENSVSRLAHCGKRIGKQLLKRLPRFKPRLEVRSYRAELLLTHRFIFFRQRINSVGSAFDLFQLSFAVITE